MTDLDTLLAEMLAEMDAASVNLTADDLSVVQRKALDKAIAKNVFRFHEIKKLDITTSTHAGFVYVYCVAGMAGDEGTAAELFARDGFHARIGPRGGVKYL
jgi:hypothetical protein